MSGWAILRLLAGLVAVVGVFLFLVGYGQDSGAGVCHTTSPGETTCTAGPGEPLILSGGTAFSVGVTGFVLAMVLPRRGRGR